MDDFTVEDGELAGFGLAGYVQPSGVIELTGSKRFIKKWPEEITVLGCTYELEEVTSGAIDEKTGAIFQNAEYC